MRTRLKGVRKDKREKQHKMFAGVRGAELRVKISRVLLSAALLPL